MQHLNRARYVSVGEAAELRQRRVTRNILRSRSCGDFAEDAVPGAEGHPGRIPIVDTAAQVPDALEGDLRFAGEDDAEDRAVRDRGLSALKDQCVPRLVGPGCLHLTPAPRDSREPNRRGGSAPPPITAFGMSWKASTPPRPRRGAWWRWLA